MTGEALDGQNGEARRVFSAASFFQTFYTPAENAARKIIIEKIEVERQVFHERIEPLLKQLAEIRGAITWMGQSL